MAVCKIANKVKASIWLLHSGFVQYLLAEVGLGPVRFKTHSFRAIRGKQLQKAASNFTMKVRTIPPGGQYLLANLRKEICQIIDFRKYCPQGLVIRSIGISHRSY